MIRKAFIQKSLVIAAAAAAIWAAGGSCVAQQSPAPATTTQPTTPTQPTTTTQPTATTQQTAPETPQPQQAAPLTPEQQREQAARDVQAQKKQRILGVMPEFNTTNNQNAPPLSAGQKFDLAFHSATDPWQFFLAGVDSGIGQAQNSFPGYGQGWKGYGKRFGAAYLDSFDGTMIGNAMFPALLHQDPRYFRKGTGTFWHRFFYAASSTVRCKGDNGKWEWNYSNVSGNLVAGAISNVYYPPSDRGLGLTFERAGTVTAEGAIGAELLEFWPDIQRHFMNKRKKKDGDVAAHAATPDAPK